MSRQKAALTFVFGVDTLIASGMPSGPTAPLDLSTAANVRASRLDRGFSIAVRVTRALLDI